MTDSSTIDWDNIKLYHGTSDKYLDSIISKGFYIPQHDRNWLGKGTYFAVNNIFLPILFSNSHVKSESGDCSAIIEIHGKYLSDSIKSKIINLTTQQDLNLFHNISKDFNDFISPYDNYPELKKELNLQEEHFSASPFYEKKLERTLLPSLNWFMLALGIGSETDLLEMSGDKEIARLKAKSTENITNIIYDWFNYKYSCGIENEVPIRGVMASFDSGEGTPIALAKILKKHKLNRSFSDYVTYLNRTELSIFGYDYYRSDGEFWDFNKLFDVENPLLDMHYCKYVGKGPIESLLADSFEKSKKYGYAMDRKDISDLYELLISERDVN